MKKTTKKVTNPDKTAISAKVAGTNVGAKRISSTQGAVQTKRVAPSSPQRVPAPKKNTAPKEAAASSDTHSPSTEMETYKVKLLNLRARLSGDVLTMTDAALNKNRLEASGDLSAMPIHMADVGTDNFEQEQTLSFMQNETGMLDQVDEALERIKDGTYGICESCGNRIPKVRLNLLPYTALCVKCVGNSEHE